MKRIIIPVIVTFSLLVITNTTNAQVTVQEDSLKAEKKENAVKTEKVKLKSTKKFKNVKNEQKVDNSSNDPNQKITVTEEGIEKDKTKKPPKTEVKEEETKPLKGEEKKGTEHHVPKKEE